MKRVELYGRVRHAVMIEGLSQREAARCFGIDPRTVRKMLSYSVPPGYVRTRPPVRPKLDPFIGIIDRILEEDKDRPKKQRHTSKRIFERLRDEYGFTGKITIVKDYICGVRQRRREMFVPLTHPPGHAQVDFGEALAVIGGVERKIHFLAMSLPHSDACFVKGLIRLTSRITYFFTSFEFSRFTLRRLGSGGLTAENRARATLSGLASILTCRTVGRPRLLRGDLLCWSWVIISTFIFACASSLAS